MNSVFGTRAKAAGFLGRGKSVTFYSTITVFNAFAFSVKMHGKLSTGAKAVGFFDFGVTLQGRNYGVAMVFCSQRVRIASQLRYQAESPLPVASSYKSECETPVKGIEPRKCQSFVNCDIMLSTARIKQMMQSRCG